MTAQLAPQRTAFEVLWPSQYGWSAQRIVSVTGAAQLVDLNATWGAVAVAKRFIHYDRLAQGGAWVRVSARGGTLYLRRRVVDASPLTLTAGPTSEGLPIADGTYEDAYVSAELAGLEVIGSGAMSMGLYFSSHNPGNLEPAT